MVCWNDQPQDEARNRLERCLGRLGMYVRTKAPRQLIRRELRMARKLATAVHAPQEVFQLFAAMEAVDEELT